ncbi:tetratricopeptide repeat protein [Chitinimonas sp. PSY-7]|uniref:tetratricopeptide repeat protein n=1 Tax=Chitinimonas sp. PSY-7 TaxID=3459088 RepID=UPI00404033FB
MLRLWLLLLLAARAAAAVDIDTLPYNERPDEAEKQLQQIIQEAKRTGDDFVANEALTQLARAQGVQRRYDEAHATLDQVRDTLSDQSPTLSLRYSLERGRLWFAVGDRQRAWRWFHGAYVQATQQKLDFFAIDAMHMLATVDNDRSALAWHRKAIATAEQSRDPRNKNWLGSLYNNMGWYFYDKKDYAQALDYLQRAQAWHEAHQTGRPLLLARWSVAKLHRVMNQPDTALPMQLALEKAWEQAGAEDGYVFEEIGENLLALGQDADARPYFNRAFMVLAKDPWLVKNQADRLRRLYQLSQ